MKKPKISVFFGTRPETIKLAPVILRMQDDPEVECHTCAVSQHRQMLDQVTAAFQIKPDRDLDLMRPAQTLNVFAARAIESVDGYLAAERPDLVLVQGDTTTVLCVALAAFNRHIQIGHVEAGLRTGDLQAPWPE
jgi:UDP-N-acetylglucosamine 2-epimerase (non-hydrolysing)